jgi:hypothetical protein
MGKRWGLTNPRRLCYGQEMRNHTCRLHQKRRALASPRRLVVLHTCKWVGKSYKKLDCTQIITQACPLWCKITHRLQSSLIHQIGRPQDLSKLGSLELAFDSSWISGRLEVEDHYGGGGWLGDVEAQSSILLLPFPSVDRRRWRERRPQSACSSW